MKKKADKTKAEKPERKKKRRRKIVFLMLSVFFFILGIGLVVYPWLSNYLYENRAVSAISAYTESVDEIEDDDVDAYLKAAREYNEALQQDQSRLVDPFNEEEFDASYADDYWDLLMISESGVMGYVEIPSISVYLPVYHGTAESTLLAGIGHMQGSSLPIGGESTHAVLTGHSGLSSAKMFTDLDLLEEGDYFYFHIMGETLAYQIISITVTLPNVVNSLRIQEGEDLMTLVTCTPYGVNSHRLLVTGTRVEFSEKVYEESKQEKKSASESKWMESYKKAIVIGILISLLIFPLIFFLYWLLSRKRKGKKRRKRTERPNAPRGEESP